MRRPELSDYHDCDRCHGKMVMISLDALGVTRCGYCNAVVDYHAYMRAEKAYLKSKGLWLWDAYEEED